MTRWIALILWLIAAPAMAQFPLSLPSKPVGPNPPPPTDAVTITPTGGGPAVTYLISSGTNLGSWTNPSATFTQQNIKLARQSAYPCLDVYYRPDTTSSRKEVVLEADDATCATPTDYAGYSVRLSIGGSVVPIMVQGGSLQSAVTTPIHYWAARWRVFTAPRPIITTTAALVTAGLIPGLDNVAPITTSVTPYTPMGSGSITTYMGTTGDYNNIGISPDWTSEWIANGNTLARDQQTANAEASGTVNWHWRDSNGQIFNIDNFPNNCVNPATCGSPVANFGGTANPFTVDVAHWPELNYISYLQTEDPYLLEELQFQADFCLYYLSSPNSLGLFWGNSVIQPRAWAWSARTLAHAAIATPSATTYPKGLPQEYLLRKLENNRKWFEAQTTNAISPPMAFSHLAWIEMPGNYNGPTSVSSWQNDYSGGTIAHMVQAGLSQWVPQMNWLSGNWITRTVAVGTGGWNRSVASWYYVGLGTDPTFPDFYTVVTPWASAWSQVMGQPSPFGFATNQTYFTTGCLAPLPSPDDTFSAYVASKTCGTSLFITVGASYIGYLRGELRLGISQGLSLSTNLAWLEGQIAATTLGDWYKWMFKSTAITHAPQPTSSGDPQYVSPHQSVTAGGTTVLGVDKWFATGTGLGSNQTLDATANFYAGAIAAMQYTGAFAGTCEFNRSAGFRLLVTKNIRFITLGTKTFDCQAGTWSP